MIVFIFLFSTVGCCFVFGVFLYKPIPNRPLHEMATLSSIAFFGSEQKPADGASVAPPASLSRFVGLASSIAER